MELCTDGDAADAGRLDARHGGAVAQGRRMAGDGGGAALAEPTRGSGRRRRGADTGSSRARRSPSEAGLSARRRRAAGGGARAHQVRGYDREAGPRPSHKSNFAHSHAVHDPLLHIPYSGRGIFHNHNASYS
jgi:hypothetical protein